MKVIDAKKMRDLFYWGKNDEPIISEDIDRKIIEIIDACSIDVDIEEKSFE